MQVGDARTGVLGEEVAEEALGGEELGVLRGLEPLLQLPFRGLGLKEGQEHAEVEPHPADLEHLVHQHL